MFSARLPYSPSPSPPSSPAPCIDSSPLNSPSLTPMILDNYDTEDDPQTTLVSRSVPSSRAIDPFAASAVPDWIPPQYERRLPGSTRMGKRARAERDPLATPPGSAKKTRYHYRAMHRSVSSETVFGLRKIDLNICNSRDVMDCQQSCEEQIWEEESTKAFNGNGNLDLSNKGLTHISRKFIEDLENIYIPPISLDSFRPTDSEMSTSPGNPYRLFSRSLTAPAEIEDFGSYLSSSEAKTVARERARRVKTISDVSLGFPKGDIALYLMGNQITKLPKELFNLQKLTILSIRNNKLTNLPPEIRYLSSLHTLNVAYNQLRYLPSEMLEMSLTNLNVHPNPFLESDTALLQPTHLLPRVIPLVEVCLRKLLSPTSVHRGEPILAVHYELPLRECKPQDMDPPPLPGRKRVSEALPPHVRKALDVCLPGSVYDLGDEGAEDSQYNDDNITGLGCCPYATKGKAGENCGVFVRHAEERFSWESKIANVQVGARVPVRWRGCNWGCLGFLDEVARGTSDDGTEAAAVRPLEVGSSLDFDDD